MVNIIIIAVLSASSLLFLAGNDEPPMPPPVPVVSQEIPSFDLIAEAMIWVGACSVVCSLIWGTAIVNVAKIKRKERNGDHR